MGNTASHAYSSSPFTFATVDDIPPGMAPPSVAEIQRKVKEVAAYMTQKFDPVDIRTCRECLSRTKQYDTQTVDRIRTDLSTYDWDQPAFTEKTYQFKLRNAPEIWISSTKNSDHTLSYWFQHPILPFHIQSAFLSCMGIPITPENMFKIGKRYPAIYQQLLKTHQNEVTKCEQIEPLYVDMALRALVARGYKAYPQTLSVD